MERRLGVECVEHRLDDQQVRPAVDQAFGGLPVGDPQRVEIDIARRRVLDIGGDRGGAVGRPDGARHPARPPVPAAIHDGAGDSGRSLVDLPGESFHAVIGQRDPGSVEAVGL